MIKHNMGIIPFFCRRYPKITKTISIVAIVFVCAAAYEICKRQKGLFNKGPKKSGADRPLPSHDRINNRSTELDITDETAGVGDNTEEKILVPPTDYNTASDHLPVSSTVEKLTGSENPWLKRSDTPVQHVNMKIRFCVHVDEIPELKYERTHAPSYENNDGVNNRKSKVIPVYSLN